MRLKSTLAALALGLATLSAPAAPALAQKQDKPEPARVYKDWVVGCPSSCEVVVVWPEGDAEGYTLTMSMRAWRYASFDLDLVLYDPSGETLQPHNGPYRLLVDGKAFVPFEWNEKAEGWYGSLKRSHSIALAKGKLGEIVDREGNRVSYISLSGAMAAMRDMDERMGIAGYTHALVVKGTKKEKPVPMRAAVFTARPNFLDPPHTPSSFVLNEAVEKSGCAADRDDTDKNLDSVYPLSAPKGTSSQALIFVGCGQGAYNIKVMPFLATRDSDGKWIVTEIMVHFEYSGEEKQPLGMLANAKWDNKTRRLTHFNKGRGLGDCGDSAEYQLEMDPRGRAFFWPTAIREMPVCRGATHWPAIW